MGNFKRMEEITKKHQIKVAYVDGKKVAGISDDLSRTKITDIIECFINKEFIKRIHKEEKSHYKQNRKVWAGLTIINGLKLIHAKS